MRVGTVSELWRYPVKSMCSDDDRVDELLSAALGRRVSLHPRRPADHHEHYRRLAVDEADLGALTPGTIREGDDFQLV